MATAAQNWLGLEGRVIVITGAAGGIGAAIARAACAQGARAILVDRPQADTASVLAELQANGGLAAAHDCDVADAHSWADLARRVLADCGPAAGLVNAAGILRPGPIADLGYDEWRQVLAVDLDSCFLGAQAFLPQLAQADGGSIVHISSIAGQVPQTGGGAYSAAKAALIALSRQIAVESGAQGVRSNTLSPGMIDTPMAAAFNRDPDIRAARERFVPRRAIGQPDEIANVALFLLSPRSSFVNGADIAVDGGMSSMLMDLLPRPGFSQ